MATAAARKVALITGGTGGVGKAVCDQMSQRGYDIDFTFRSQAKAAQEIESSVGGYTTAHQVDLNDCDSLQATVDQIVSYRGRVDAVIHAAGPYVEQEYVSQLTSEQFRNHTDIELLGFFNLVQATLPSLRVNGGSIVAVTSFAVRNPPPRDALSAVPKAGVEALVRSIAVEEGKFNVRANCVGPGALSDGMTDQIRERGAISYELIDTVIPTIPLRRLGEGKEVARAACFLASEEAAYITGQSLDVDGGIQL